MIFISNPESKEISVIDGLKLENIKNISLGKGPLGIALTKDDKLLLVADWYDNKVRVINTNTLKLYDYLRSPITNPQANNLINYISTNRHLPTIQYPLTTIYSNKKI